MTDLERYNKDKALVIAIIKYILIFAIAGVVIFGLTKLIAIMVPFLVGFLLAKTSHMIADPISRLIFKPKEDHKPVVAKKQKKRSKFASLFVEENSNSKKTGRVICALIVYVLLLVIATLLCVWGVLELLTQANTLLSKIATITKDFNYDSLDISALDKFSEENGGILSPEIIALAKENIYSLANRAISFLPTALTYCITYIWDIIGSLPTVLFIIICVILSGYYFIADGPTVTKMYFKNIPNKDFRKKSFTLLNDLSETLFRVLGGYFSLLIITAVETAIVLYFADVKYILILSIITGLIDFLPVLGISATLIPTIGYCAIHGNFKGVVVIIIGMAIMTVLRRILEPLILGKSMKLHPLLMLIAMVIGMYVWGAIGFLLGPTAMIIVIQIMKVFNLDKKATAFMSIVLKRFMSSPESDEQSEKTTKTTEKSNDKKVQEVVSEAVETVTPIVTTDSSDKKTASSKNKPNKQKPKSDK